MGEDERKEAAIASTAVLQPNFKPKGLTQQQLSKFQELHRKRLQIKSKSKFEKKPKAVTGKFHRKNHKETDLTIQDSSMSVEDSTVPKSESHNNGSSSSGQQEDAPKKRQKLHWGLDTKECWERKANM
ncbi:uncharacterized protein LOC126790586 [Argentina anserina]|uniref:uncharacterized protein LOC126790586 n=1 Tax=Argentina anserina TaxID=57926 RepID=UPI00217692C1|nr:uncharacterized protein LOC126790586 [Potentilla anserina]